MKLPGRRTLFALLAGAGVVSFAARRSWARRRGTPRPPLSAILTVTFVDHDGEEIKAGAVIVPDGEKTTAVGSAMPACQRDVEDAMLWAIEVIRNRLEYKGRPFA